MQFEKSWRVGQICRVTERPAAPFLVFLARSGQSGDLVSFGPAVVSTQNAKSTLSSFSFSGGYNFTPWLGGGGSVNSSGAASGNTFGVPGAEVPSLGQSAVVGKRERACITHLSSRLVCS
jgi:hypothetical protein